MSDHNDPRVRELTYRLMQMAPDAPPFPQEATMTVPETKQRPPMLVWAAAVAAVVLLVGLPLFLLRGGDTGPEDVATTLAVGPTTTVEEPTTTIPNETTTTVPATTTPLPSGLLPITTSGDCRQDWEELGNRDVYTTYVFFGCDRPGMEELLVPRPREVRGPLDGIPGNAFELQFAGPTDEELAAGYLAFTIEDDGVLSPATALEGATISSPGPSEYRFADFRSNSGMANASASAASSHLLAQLSSVAFQFPGVDAVTFGFGEDCDAFWNWLQRDCTTIERSDWGDGELTAGVAAWWTSLAGSVPTTTVPPDDVTTTTLPGEAFDIGPAAGDVVAVVGVAYDDVLHVRNGPGTGYEPFVDLDPLADDVVATGRHRLLESSIWSEVTADGVTGWVNSRYIGFLGGVDDLTSQVVANLGGIPEAATMLDLGTLVAESFEGEESGFRFEISVAPTVGDLGEITADVLGLADDALYGYRLHIFGQPSGESFSLASVEATAICGRGVTAEGFCV